ncbi:23S rRNA (guanosine2251-2'-O)-methyltransferase [Propionibacteriaceae bacterium ES.041]|uniref:23S rRNA (guanosine(2251)-2'-O)-methyltransferase RlmB n=1 Tax=Enemella evansiae TaxID=2016499 RepID=UPI000B970448|nr:23S rRNA (guanosine(2251)-2'-O)-methyltransferase RlmB [Enemella evansiae]OYO04690.1 23S rRNA (guanosine(2251)-2'-O)-methyltransferase RlmB [Enemella evansiae]PFG66068.1 23S rRNA (guanosine2251-2'-O)-methyltransferase [Propionibacteriaceae bacterium ES.041]
MPGNSQRKGAVRRKGRGNTAGSGGRVRRGLEGKGPTPKAEDRPYHKAHKQKQRQSSGGAGQRPRSQAPRTGRPGSGPEWVAGRNPVLEALQAGIPVQTAFVAEGADRDDRLREIMKFCADHSIPLMQATRTDLDRMTGGAIHQSVALKLPEYEYAHPDDLLADALDSEEPPLVVMLDQITDPRNLGAIVRSAAAFGANGVVIPERRSASMTAAAWKTSAGAAARLPIARATNLNRTLQAYAKAGFTIVGLAGDGDTDIEGVPGVDGPLVLVVGSEGEGLSRLVRENCDVLASIPIASDVESLNAGVATGIALYEVSRHR